MQGPKARVYDGRGFHSVPKRSAQKGGDGNGGTTISIIAIFLMLF